MEKFLQYHRITELYELHLWKNTETIVLQMAPDTVYRIYRSYYLTAPVENLNLIQERFQSVFRIAMYWTS